MLYAVQALIGFRNSARRDLAMGNVQTRLQQNVPWGITKLGTSTLKSGDPAFYAEVRFNTKAEQQAFWTDLQAFLGSGVNGPTSGSEWYGHDCAHTTPDSAPCVRDPAMQGSA